MPGCGTTGWADRRGWTRHQPGLHGMEHRGALLRVEWDMSCALGLDWSGGVEVDAGDGDAHQVAAVVSPGEDRVGEAPVDVSEQHVEVPQLSWLDVGGSGLRFWIRDAARAPSPAACPVPRRPRRFRV